MTIRWSSVHEQLGESPQDLTYDLIATAVKQQVVEADNLDWKQVLPGKEEARLEEFAKDVAAMANSRGGLLVYGVSEERGKGQAKEIVGVDVSEPTQRRLRMLSASRIHPMVPGLQLLPLTSPDGQHSVLVLSVPRSPDAPHMVGQDSKIGVPFRDGPETRWMRERDIERAYADRFARREDENVALTALADEVVGQLDLGRGAWIVGSARPRTPMPSVSAPPAREKATKILEATLRRSAEITPSGVNRLSLLRELGSAASNPRVGLRRWIARTTKSFEPGELSSYVHVELHHDGSVVFAAALEGWYQQFIEDQYQVPCSLVESFAADFVALVETYGRHIGEHVSLPFRLELRRENDDRAFGAISPANYGGFVSSHLEQVPGSRSVRRFVPVVGEVPPVADSDMLRDAARTAATDVLHQFGVDRLMLLP